MVSDKVLLPKALTAENGAESALMGEFSVKFPVFCHDCDNNGDLDCETCGGSGTLIQQINVPWVLIKEIYARIVKELGTTPETSKESPPQPEQTGLKQTE